MENREHINRLNDELWKQYKEDMRRFMETATYDEKFIGYYSYEDWLLVEYDALLRKFGEQGGSDGTAK